MVRINLYSDTQTQPTIGMRQAMSRAEVGDEQQFLDPSVNQLCDEVSKLLRKDSALFLPSGTMCNQIALAVHCVAGDEIIADQTSHVINNEAAGAAAICGAAIRPIQGKRGIFSADDVERSLRAGRALEPRSRLVVVEQSSNAGGGSIWPIKTLEEISVVARTHDLAMHMDGARLLNATVSSGIDAYRYANTVDSVWLDLSKGLGCPIGAVLAGSDNFIRKAWRWKHRLGGAMRQAGVIAAAGLYSLEHHVARLAEDHSNAKLFAQLVSSIEGVTVLNPEVETNLVFFDVSQTKYTSADLSTELRNHGVWIGAPTSTSMRAVTHLDISQSDIEEAADLIRQLIS
ncbi:MAG: low specificity L-threonine aldolase [Acidiferrobacteraceae bacterium]|nr:low specificity L-threonine aldolase [Acidiferrobacteraceae bacterium]